METKFTDGNWFVYVDANDHPGIESNAGQSIVIWGMRTCSLLRLTCSEP